ncbi:SAM domain (Sterile alpha motif), putative [Trypanosoma equiperdum]|uniref:SAM domain-containing protein n=2 Tax=Trypanozoon TaxID=39700 RepID=Q585L8_TRYB2|nr:hypothetical protein, conserved [Trypanosoma brucei brucei TREU927]AAX79729.1 hypothetical protein, conserved [Trypanosoma brucei]AAZ11755.1 hypothetical protein, conserved [Trypanosoma brucei brucei TREU927]SCU69169.1 SAM domain (Sterile alpha motif), putative [Trypanosoma equiperdum]
MSTRSGVNVLMLVLMLRQALPVQSSEEAVVIRPSPINKPVSSWNVVDVEYWMNNTLGYPEYSGYIRKHLIDGPTLLELTPADFEEHFPIENSIHVVKFSAHLKLLKGSCMCGEGVSTSAEFWSYFKQEPFRVFVIGSTTLVFPRISMLYICLFDNELYDMLIGVSASQSEVLTANMKEHKEAFETARTIPFLHKVLYLISMIAAPSLFMAFQAVRMLTTNYFVMSLIITHFLLSAYDEYVFVSLAYAGVALLPGSTLFSKIRNMVSFTIFIPPAFLALYYILPHYLQVFVVCLVLLYILFMFFCIIVVRFGRDPAGTASGTRRGEGRPSDKSG